MSKINVITYSRVSTDEQADTGFSLNHQAEMLKKYCELKNFNLVKHFTEDYSAKNFDRPEWNLLMQYVRKNRHSIDMILFTKWDRFSRNIEGALTVIRHLSELGIQVNSIEQPLDLNIPDNKVMLSMYLILPEVENDKISQRTKDGMRRAKKEGCFIAKAPFGYSNCKILEKTSIEPNSDAKIVIKAFTEVAKGLEHVEVIRKRFTDVYGLKLQKQQFYNMLRNITYCGMIQIDEYKKEQAETIKGIHEPIIDIKLYKTVQDVLDGRKNPNAKLPSTNHDIYPLKGNLLCPNCGNKITASPSKGNGGEYHYYHCKSKCKIRLRKEIVDTRIQNLLDELALSDNVKELFKAILRDVIQSNTVDAQKRINELESERKAIESMLEKAEDKCIVGDLAPDDFYKVKNRYSDKLSEIENRIDALRENDTNLIRYIDDSVDLLSQLGTVFNRLQNEQKSPFLRVIYPENIILEKSGFRTNVTNSIVELMTRIYSVSEVPETKQAIKNDSLSNQAPPLGLEPRTP